MLNEIQLQIFGLICQVVKQIIKAPGPMSFFFARLVRGDPDVNDHRSRHDVDQHGYLPFGRFQITQHETSTSAMLRHKFDM